METRYFVTEGSAPDIEVVATGKRDDLNDLLDEMSAEQTLWEAVSIPPDFMDWQLADSKNRPHLRHPNG